MMATILRFEVPRPIWEDEGAFQVWLWLRLIDGFFWEVDRYPEYVTIEIIE
jgi:hypothetical protein